MSEQGNPVGTELGNTWLTNQEIGSSNKVLLTAEGRHGGVKADVTITQGTKAIHLVLSHQQLAELGRQFSEFASRVNARATPDSICG